MALLQRGYKFNLTISNKPLLLQKRRRLHEGHGEAEVFGPNANGKAHQLGEIKDGYLRAGVPLLAVQVELTEGTDHRDQIGTIGPGGIKQPGSELPGDI